jgi:hypothetical protein
MRKRIADYVADYMREENMSSVCWGDGFLVDASASHIRGKMSKHPLDIMTAACNALERAPDIFEKFMMRGHDCNGNPRVVRAFRLKDLENVR